MIRNIYVDVGDMVVVHVMKSPELPKTKKEWEGQVRPVQYSFTINSIGLTFTNPGWIAACSNIAERRG